MIGYCSEQSSADVRRPCIDTPGDDNSNRRNCRWRPCVGQRRFCFDASYKCLGSRLRHHSRLRQRSRPENASAPKDARRIGLARDVVPLADLKKAGPKVVKQLANGPEALAKNQGAGNGELVWHERR
jgi:hypothetical protein